MYKMFTFSKREVVCKGYKFGYERPFWNNNYYYYPKSLQLSYEKLKLSYALYT